MAVVTESTLSDALLAKCRERAPEYDRENRFFHEDFNDLKAAGYLRMALPREFGGLGMSAAPHATATAAPTWKPASSSPGRSE